MPKRKSKPRNVPCTKPIKLAALVIAAIQNLRETKGSSSGKIIDYITLASDMAQGRVKPQVKAALKRGVEYGVLKRFRGHYFLPMGDDLDRADRIANRFAKLPIQVPSGTKYKTTNPKGFSTKKSLKAQTLLDMKKRVRKARSMPLSLTSTATERSYSHNQEQRSSFESDID